MKNDLSKAKKLIRECLDTKNIYLDLGNCGITDLTDLPELFECGHVQILILSNAWFNEEGNYVQSRNYGQPNELIKLTSNIAKFSKLKKLIIKTCLIKII